MPKKGVEPPALRRWRLSRGTKRTMARRKSRRGAVGYRRSYRRRGRHHKPGLIGQATGAVRKISNGIVHISGPLMMGAGGAVLAAPTVFAALDVAKAGRGNTGAGVQSTMLGAGQETLAVAGPAAALLVLGYVLRKATATFH